MGLSSAPLASSAKEGPLEVASRERSYQGSLPDVHEEVCSQVIGGLQSIPSHLCLEAFYSCAAASA